MDTIRTTFPAQDQVAKSSQHLIPAQSQEAQKQIPRPGDTTTESVSLPADVAVTTRSSSIPANSACATPSRGFDAVCSIVNDRLYQLADAMKQSGLPASDQMQKQLVSAIDRTREAGNIVEVNRLWAECHQRVSGNPDNPTTYQLVKGLKSCDSKEEALAVLRSAINLIELDADQNIRDFFLVDLIAHFMTIGVYIALFGQAHVFDRELVDKLGVALAHHDMTKVFEKDDTTVNTANLKGYMLLPIVFGALSKDPEIKKHRIAIPAEVRPGKSLENTCIAAPICSHVKSEPHHPEYHIHKNQPMPEIDIFEFMVDGLAAGSRPDRFAPDAQFSETLPESLSFWQNRLGFAENQVAPPLWGALSNAESVARATQQMVNQLQESIGDVRLADYFGQPVT